MDLRTDDGGALPGVPGASGEEPVSAPAVGGVVLAPCPFCERDWAKVDRSHQLPVIICDFCGAQGPYGETLQAALEAWNKRK